MTNERRDRHPKEIVRSLLADSAADLAEVRRVRTSLRQWDRGCFRAQQAAVKSLRALRVALGDQADAAPRSVAEEARAIGSRALEISSRAPDAERLDRYFLRTGLPLGSPQIHGENDCVVAEEAAIGFVTAAVERLRAAGFEGDGAA
jgi:HEPN domain-containing protein